MMSNLRFLAKKYNLLLIFLLILGGIFSPASPAHALWTVPFDIASMTLDALDFVDNVILTLYVWLPILAVFSGVFIIFTAQLLDWSSGLPVNLDNVLVQRGWDFTSGLVNIAFILIFVFIALAFIFNKETFEMKKALPRLIIIALLVNFSLLFVKIFADIGWIVQNSFKSAFGAGGLAKPVADAIIPVLRSVIVENFLGLLMAYIAVAVIPFVNVARVVLLAGAFLQEAFLGTLSQAFLLFTFGFVGGGIFLIYSIFFLLRIVIIWFLAIAAPLAFVAFILPQTQKFFSQWLKALSQWVFLGIVVFFLMGLGLKLFVLVTPGGGATFVGGFEETSFATDYSKFIFLLIYLAAVFWAAKKFTPAGTEFVWKAMERGGKAAGVVGALAAWRGATATTKAMKAGMEKARRTYAAGRRMGLPRHVALGEAMRRRWERKIKPVIGPKAAAKGTLKAIGDIAKAGALAGLGIKMKKKGLKNCPGCGQKIAASAKFCPKCGYNFE